MNDWQKRPGERFGWNWRLQIAPNFGVLYDTNSWKTVIAQRILMSPGDVGTFTVFQDTPIMHRMYAEHLSSEYAIPTTKLGNTINEWHIRPQHENHLWDGTIGCFVAANEQGIGLAGASQQPKPKPPVRPRRRFQLVG